VPLRETKPQWLQRVFVSLGDILFVLGKATAYLLWFGNLHMGLEIEVPEIVEVRWAEVAEVQ
jgi:hypothetical protein